MGKSRERNCATLQPRQEPGAAVASQLPTPSQRAGPGAEGTRRAGPDAHGTRGTYKAMTAGPGKGGSDSEGATTRCRRSAAARRYPCDCAPAGRGDGRCSAARARRHSRFVNHCFGIIRINGRAVAMGATARPAYYWQPRAPPTRREAERPGTSESDTGQSQGTLSPRPPERGRGRKPTGALLAGPASLKGGRARPSRRGTSLKARHVPQDADACGATAPAPHPGRSAAGRRVAGLSDRPRRSGPLAPAPPPPPVLLLLLVVVVVAAAAATAAAAAAAA